MSPRILVDTPHKDIRLVIQNYVFPKEKKVMTEKSKFLSLIQRGTRRRFPGTSQRKFFDFKKLEEVLVKIKIISFLEEPDANLRLLDGIKAELAMLNAKMTESLKFTSQAMAFANFSSGHKHFTVKEEVGYNFKKIF